MLCLECYHTLHHSSPQTLADSKIVQKYALLRDAYLAANQMEAAASVACRTLRWSDDIHWIKEFISVCEKAV